MRAHFRGRRMGMVGCLIFYFIIISKNFGLLPNGIGFISLAKKFY